MEWYLKESLKENFYSNKHRYYVSEDAEIVPTLK
jgi:hypothetical protein